MDDTHINNLFKQISQQYLDRATVSPKAIKKLIEIFKPLIQSGKLVHMKDQVIDEIIEEAHLGQINMDPKAIKMLQQIREETFESNSQRHQSQDDDNEKTKIK